MSDNDMTEGMVEVGNSMIVEPDVDLELIKRRMTSTESYIQKKRKCVFDILKNHISKWMGPQYNYNDREYKHSLESKIDEFIKVLKKEDNLEKLKESFRDYKEPESSTENWLPVYQSFIASFTSKIGEFNGRNDFWQSFVEIYYPTNSHAKSGPKSADKLFKLIECLIFLTSSIISLDEDKKMVKKGGRKTYKRKQTKKYKKRNNTKSRK